jgi:hypothetical protein
MASAWLQNSKVKPSGESQTYAEVSTYDPPDHLLNAQTLFLDRRPSRQIAVQSTAGQ